MKKGENGTVKVGARVTNTGTVAGEEVVQLYVRSPKASGDRRRLHLEGFRRVALKPGETNVVFDLSADPADVCWFTDGKVLGLSSQTRSASFAPGRHVLLAIPTDPAYPSATVRFSVSP